MTRPTIDELEMLNPDQLGRLLITEVWKASPDVQYIQDLLDVGCPIDIRGEFDWTPLHLAARNGHIEVVKFLVSREAYVDNIDEFGNTSLHLAAINGNREVVSFLISKGAYVDYRDTWAKTVRGIVTIPIREELPELEPK